MSDDDGTPRRGGARPGAGRRALTDRERRDVKIMVSLTPSESAEIIARAAGGSFAIAVRELALAAVRGGVALEEAPRAGRAARESALGEALIGYVAGLQSAPRSRKRAPKGE